IAAATIAVPTIIVSAVVMAAPISGLPAAVAVRYRLRYLLLWRWPGSRGFHPDAVPSVRQGIVKDGWFGGAH
ncbi:MAG: hypothetical protein RL254_2233, partial [Planctomycetota bacterium]